MERNYVFLIIVTQYLHVTLYCAALVSFLLRKGLKLLKKQNKTNMIGILYSLRSNLQSYSYKVHSFFCSGLMADFSYTKILRFYMHLFVCCVHRNVGFQSILSNSFKRKGQMEQFCPYKYYSTCNIAKVLSCALDDR